MSAGRPRRVDDGCQAPFFASGGGDPARSRLLLVSRHFPPGQAAGALRWERLAGHAFRRGWQLDVLTLDPGQLARRDPARLDGLPPGTRVFAVRAPEPPEGRLETALHRLLRGGRSSGAGVETRGDGHEADDDEEADAGAGDTEAKASGRPSSLSRREARLRPWSGADLRRGFLSWTAQRREAAWAREAVRVGRRVLAEEPSIRLVVSCGPPHAAHEAARRLAGGAGLPFVMDLRDPWSQVQRLPEHLSSPVWYGLARRHERRCVRAAALVVANTEPAREALARLHPDAADRVMTVMNGFDDDPLPEPSGEPRFLIAHAGTVYLDRDPGPLFRAIARVVRETGLAPDRLAVPFIGCTDDGVRRLADDEGIGAHFEPVPFLPRDELARRLVECAVLVVLPQDSDMAIPSKLFEYLRYPAWVLAMAEPGSATERVLRDTPAAVASAADVDALAARLRGWLERFERGERPAPAADSTPELSRRAQADRLFDRLERYGPGRGGIP